MNRRVTWVGTFEVCVPTHFALRMFIMQVLASQLHFQANRNAELAIPPLFWAVNWQLHKNRGTCCSAEWPYCLFPYTVTGCPKKAFPLEITLVPLRPESTTAKFFARNCLCEIRMVGHEWFHWVLSFVSLSQWVELISTHWRSEIFSCEERIQWNYSRATIRISHKQFLVKNFAAVESGLYTVLHLCEINSIVQFVPKRGYPLKSSSSAARSNLKL